MQCDLKLRLGHRVVTIATGRSSGVFYSHAGDAQAIVGPQPVKECKEAIECAFKRFPRLKERQ